MPTLPEIYKQLVSKVMGSISHPLRGQIVGLGTKSGTTVDAAVGPGWDTPPSWDDKTQTRYADVIVTPSGASYQRLYKRVPWNVGELSQLIGETKGIPSIGDFVDLTFKGGSSEFPSITAVYAGNITAGKQALAQLDRPTTPTSTLVYGQHYPQVAVFIDSNKGRFTVRNSSSPKTPTV